MTWICVKAEGRRQEAEVGNALALVIFLSFPLLERKEDGTR
jgi:hypothetical protein